MSEIIKNCSKHGKLTMEQVIKSGKKKSGAQKYKCRQCMKDLHAKHYQKNKDKVLSAHKYYIENNKEKVKITKKESWQKNKEKYLKRDNERRLLYKRRHPEKIKEREAKRINELQDSYVRKVLLNRTNLRSEDIPYSLIEMKRALMLLKRGIKDRQEEERAKKLRESLDEIEKHN